MTRQSKKLINIHAEARIEFDRIQTVMYEEREQCVSDRRFYSLAGAQWEGQLQRQYENRPKIEINKIHLSIIRIFNEWRNNRITVNFVPKTGEKDDHLADTCDNLYRADEQDSSAQEAYDNAFEEAVGGGFGAFRLRAEHEDEYDPENDRQRILIEPIYDADKSVFFDLGAKKYDKSDAKCCFVLTSYTREDFTEKWGESPATWPNVNDRDIYFDWSSPDVVYVAEYYEVEEVKESIYIYKTLDGEEEKYTDSDFDNDIELESRLEAIGTTFERLRKVTTRRIHKYIMSGDRILEDCGYIAGKCIPVIPVYGKRWFVDNVERQMGHVRLAKDAQRLKNMQMSTLAELSSLFKVEKPIFTPQQVQGHEDLWASDNIVNNPYMLLNEITDVNGQSQPVGPIGYTKVPNIPPAMAALLQITDTDMKEILGNQQAGEQIQPNLSGKAIELIQKRLDMQTFIYMSNMSKSIKRAGEVWLSMASELFVEEGRTMKGITEQGETSSIIVSRPFMDQKTGEIEYQNDLSKAKYDVTVTVGPSSDSKRAATVQSITDVLKYVQDPETLQALTNMMVMNMEGEGIGDVRKWLRNKLVRMGVVKPTEEEAKEMAEELQNQRPDANEQYLQAAAQEAQAKSSKAQTDAALNMAKIEQTRALAEKAKAETIEVLSGIEEGEQERATETIETFSPEQPQTLQVQEASQVPQVQEASQQPAI